MKKTETPKPKCSYCGKEKYFIFHRDKKHEIDWAICFKCLKEFCDKILGVGKNGGRIVAK